MSSLPAKQSPFAWAMILVLLGTVLHLVLGFTTELSVDEAHYALYADRIAWSYFDHPPLVGWIQWPLVAIDASDGILRLIPIVLWILSCFLVYQLGYQFSEYCKTQKLFKNSFNPIASSLAGLLSVVVVAFAPLPHVLAVGLVPDSLLTPLSLGIMWLAFCWIKQDGKYSVWKWLALSLLFGLAGLSKYTAVLYAIAFLVVLLTVSRLTFIKQSGFYVAVFTAFVLISPVLLWNASHDWISFKYQIDHGGGGTWEWRRVAAFIGLQIGVFGFLPLLGTLAYFRSMNIFAPPRVSIL